MKKSFLLILLLWSVMSMRADYYGKDCAECFVGKVFYITNVYENCYCFAKFNDSHLSLSGLIDNDKKYRNKEYKISLVHHLPGTLRYKSKYFTIDGDDNYQLLKFESQDGTTFYHVYGWGGFPSLKNSQLDCECYYNSCIKNKGDKFNKINAFYFTEDYLGYPANRIVALKADGVYRVAVVLNSAYRISSSHGIYLLFDNGDVMKDEAAECKLGYDGGLFTIECSLNMNEEQFAKLSEHQITDVKVGSEEKELPKDKSYKIMRLCAALMAK